jgi:hypothetical protein
MHGPINLKFPNNTSKWQMGFNSAFKGLMDAHLKQMPISFSEVSFRLPDFPDNRHMSVARLSDLRTFHLYPPFLVLGSVRGRVEPRFKAKKNNLIAKRTRILSVCSAVPQPTVPPRTLKNL